jgi:hypothetical protein
VRYKEHDISVIVFSGKLPLFSVQSLFFQVTPRFPFGLEKLWVGYDGDGENKVGALEIRTKRCLHLFRFNFCPPQCQAPNLWLIVLLPPKPKFACEETRHFQLREVIGFRSTSCIEFVLHYHSFYQLQKNCTVA